jgi:hypothetical protein
MAEASESISLMRNRFLSTGILLLALLASAWGNVLAAALCPHMASDHSCCHAQLSHGSASHEIMGEMQMDEMQMGDMQMTPAAAPAHESDGHAFTQPGMSCEYCIGHSQTTATPNTLRQATQARHSVELSAPLAPSRRVTVASAFVPSVTSRQHAPPVDTSARHVLLSIFRI